LVGGIEFIFLRCVSVSEIAQSTWAAIMLPPQRKFHWPPAGKIHKLLFNNFL
jgi:hypothetical protein